MKESMLLIKKISRHLLLILYFYSPLTVYNINQYEIFVKFLVLKAFTSMYAKNSIFFYKNLFFIFYVLNFQNTSY